MDRSNTAPRPQLSLIWAQDRQRLIGNKNALPWRLPADMQWFRKQTMGKPVLMGHKTYASIGKPLPGRLNLVLSRQTGLHIDGCTVVHTLDEALQAAGDAEEVMVMGGAEIYQFLLPHADRLYVTEIDASFDGDAWFPTWNAEGWRAIAEECHEPDSDNRYPYTFRILERA